MSNNLKHNIGKFINGSIYKITLNNFMTYSEIEFFPGQSLNVIIGPNGSGKSSIICAIILGLGGNLSDISKTKHISNFIKRGAEAAKIEIELYQKKKQTMVITTFLDRSRKKFVYKKDQETITKEELLRCMESMGIQVSNLCQVLPQLRVQEFSNLNPKQLLENTISAISGFNGVSIRNDLIDMSTELEQLVQGKQIMEKKVQELIKLNEKDKSKIENMEKKKELDIRQKLCEIKRRWIECNNLEEEIQGYKAEIDSKRKPIAEWENKKRKMEREKDDIHKNLKDEEGRKNEIIEKINDLRKNIIRNKDSITSDERRFEEIEAGLAQKENENLNREQELNKMSVKLEKYRQDRRAFLQKYGDEFSLKVKLEQKNKEIEKLHQHRHELERKKISIEMNKTYSDITDKIRSYRAQLAELKNRNVIRMKLLEKQFNDTYQALLWLRENRGLFRHAVYEPMLLEISFEDEYYAKFLENTVPYRDLTAFSFEDSNDMEKFLRIVRSDKGLKRVNVCKVSSDTNLHSPPIDNIRRYGFSRYLSDTFEAPHALKQYLCALYGVHRVPLGDAHAAANMERLPADLQLYFTDQRRVRVKKSAYSGLYSRNISEIRPAKLLGSNQAQIISIEENLTNLVNEQNTMTQELDRIKRERDDLTSKIGIETTSKETIRNYIEKLRSITKTLEVEERRFKEESEIDAVDMKMERAIARQQQAETTRRVLATQPDLLRDVRDLHAAALSRQELSKRIHAVNQEYVICEGKVKECEREINELENIIGASKSKMDDANRRKMANFRHIRKYCDNKLPNDPEFPFEREFETLPSRISGLTSEQCKVKREYDSIEVNFQTVKDYEDRESEKKKKLVEIEETNRKIETLNKSIQEIKPNWLNNLKSLLGKISESFGRMFDELKYVGEVLLDTGDNEEDISKYGINIMVSFRAGLPLERLDAARQSGGERAAATACYLLALQAVAAAPFRCLDEINQGMDAKNERSFVELLMRVSSEVHHCQYFLLSPKLLKNLEYNDTVKVHVIMSGESNVSSRVWEIDTFLDKARAYGRNNRDS
ncbi:unnamed protein product, partial [Brenthis ino]